MSKVSQVFNKSSLGLEDATKVKCPRCKGFGACFPQDKGGNCFLCEGRGEVWLSKEGSGWTRPLYGRLYKSQLW